MLQSYRQLRCPQNILFCQKFHATPAKYESQKPFHQVVCESFKRLNMGNEWSVCINAVFVMVLFCKAAKCFMVISFCSESLNAFMLRYIVSYNQNCNFKYEVRFAGKA